MKKSTLRNAALFCLSLLFFSTPSWAQMRSGKLGIGVSGSLYLFNPNISDGLMKPGGGLTVSYSATEYLGIRAMFGVGQLGWKDAQTRSNTTTLASGQLCLSYDMIPHGTFNPFLFVGVGGGYFDPRRDFDGLDLANSVPDMSKMEISGLGGIGFDYFFSEFISMTVSGQFAMTNTDKLDMQKKLGTNSSFSTVSLEFRYYFFDQDYVTKLIRALEDRYKKR